MKNISFFNVTRHKCVILGLLTYLISHNPIWSQCSTPVNNNFRNNGTGGLAYLALQFRQENNIREDLLFKMVRGLLIINIWIKYY